jgi:FkbM family methyltransferase
MIPIKKNLGLVYLILPYLIFNDVIKNKIGLILSIIFHNSYKIKLSNGSNIKLNNITFPTLKYLVGILNFCVHYTINSSNSLEFSLDGKNKFSLNITNLSYEEKNLLELIFHATIHGANFITESSNNFAGIREKSLLIRQDKSKKIIETSNGIKFFLDSVLPGVSIVEPFIANIHKISSNDDWNDKIIVDVGAQCGDTPLYYASLGAKVYAFEPFKPHFDAMIRNISLNPKLAKQIVPINAAIGKNGILNLNVADIEEIGSSISFVYNLTDKEKTVEVESYDLESALKKFNISHVDLLKMDCKGCEFFVLNNLENLKNVDAMKVEYVALDKSHKLDDLLSNLSKANFDYVIYKIDPFHRRSNKHVATFFAKKS